MPVARFGWLGGPHAASGARDVVVDVLTRPLTGPAVVERLHAEGRRPAVVFMSGYTEHQLPESARARPRTAFLAKPFPPAELLETVAAVARDL